MVELLQEYARRAPSGKRRRIVLRFLVSPTEILGDGAGRVRAVRIIRNALVEDGKGGLRAQPTGEEEEIEAGLVFRSVGYRGVALAGVPFHESGGVVPNAAGRVLDAAGQPIPGLYVAGWIKRGPMGVIGTNKPDAQETVAAMLEDAARGATLQPAHPEAEAAERLVRAHQPDVFVYDDWRKLDAHELAQGAAKGRPRLKLCRVEDMLAALERRASSAPAP